MNIAGIIVAGGKSSRMGAPKPFLPFGSSTLIGAVIDRVENQVSALALNLTREAERDAAAVYGSRFAFVDDAFGGERGPLGGIVAGLDWLSASGADYLATFPCDTPYLPADLVKQLAAQALKSPFHPIVAIAERPQNLCALWPRSALGPLRKGVLDEKFSAVKAALSALDAVSCKIEGDPLDFRNINTPDDLARATQ
jgi:molybdopterin-guanine dinucleotide biosynthesis protein A